MHKNTNKKISGDAIMPNGDKKSIHTSC